MDNFGFVLAKVYKICIFLKSVLQGLETVKARLPKSLRHWKYKPVNSMILT
jgi:hypothetical protein